MCPAAYQLPDGNMEPYLWCLKRMSSSQMDSLWGYRLAFTGNPSDATARAVCDTILGWFDHGVDSTKLAWETGDTARQVMYIGSKDGTEAVPDSIMHSGQSWDGKSHVDPRVFNRVWEAPTAADRLQAERLLFQVWLHETIHRHGFDHPGATKIADYLNFPYYKYVESTNPSLACISWN
jgi:hypothetical protein